MPLWLISKVVFDFEAKIGLVRAQYSVKTGFGSSCMSVSFVGFLVSLVA